MGKKIYKVQNHKSNIFNGTSRYYYQTGTLEELTKAFSYSLEVDQSRQHELGNKKINRNPKSIKTLISNLNNGAANGYSGEYYTSVPVDLDEL